MQMFVILWISNT